MPIKKTSYLLLFFYLLFITTKTNAQAEIAIRTCIDVFFEGMKEADTTKIKSVCMPNVNLTTVLKDSLMGNRLHTLSFDKFLKSIALKKEPMVYDERISDVRINADLELAAAWTPYKFYVNDRFIHCGNNLFQLVKTTNSWKIFAITDTRRKIDCE